MAPADRRLMTAEEPWALPERDRHYELVRGEPRATPLPPDKHDWLQAAIGASLVVAADAGGVGQAFGRVGFLLTSPPDTLRAPDVGFVSHERPRQTADWRRFLQGAPRSRGRDSEVTEVAEWLAYGARMVLVVDPRRRVVVVQRPGQPVRELNVNGEIDGEDVVPGWRLAVARLFREAPGR